MQNLIKRHNNKFKKRPVIIGIFFDDIEKLYNNILKAIEDNTPYNEYNMLSDKEKKLFNDGKLLF